MADAAASNFERPIRASESSIVVRDDNGLVMRVRFTVEIERLRGSKAALLNRRRFLTSGSPG